MKNYIVNQNHWRNGPIKKIVRENEKNKQMKNSMEFTASCKNENERIKKELTDNPIDSVLVNNNLTLIAC